MVIHRSRLRAVAALLVIILASVVSGCKDEASLRLRTDPEPLARRLKLPQHVGSVRWVAVSPVHDSGWVPQKTEFYDVYAYIELDDEGWTELENSEAGRRATITLPEPVAALVIPPQSAEGDFQHSSGIRQADGPSFKPLSAEAKTEVANAIRVGNALVVEMRVR